MSTVYGEKMIEPANRWREFVGGEAKRVRNALNTAKRDVKQLEQQRDRAWDDLSAALLPVLNDTLFAATSQRLQLAAIHPDSVRQESAAEIARQSARIAEIDADPLYAQREAKLNELSIRQAEIDDAIQPLQQSVNDLECEPYFAELVRVWYDTEQYFGKFWQLSYYRHWKHGDLIIAKLGERYKVKRFAELRAKYVAEQEALQQLTGERRANEQQAKRIRGLEHERNERAAAINDAPALALSLARTRIKEHLAPLSFDQIAQLLVGHEAALLQLKRIAGVGKQAEYLDAMAEHHLIPQVRQLEEAEEKAQRDVWKYQRKRYKLVPWVDVDGRIEAKRAAFGRRADKWQSQRDRLVQYDDWDRGSWVSDFLWWDLFMDGRVDGDFIPEVAHHHAHYQHDHDAAAAALARVQHDRDEVLHVDAS